MASPIERIPPARPNTPNALHQNVFVGAQITPYISQIIDLFLAVFKEPPYSYEGTYEEYLPFINIYAESPHGIACLLFDGNKLVGAATGAPLAQMPEKFRTPFEGRLDQIYYLGEVVLLPEYRKKSFGMQLYRTFETAIPASFPTLCFCKIDDGSSALNQSLSSHGFTQHPDLFFDGVWRNVDDKKESSHKLIYWSKKL